MEEEKPRALGFEDTAAFNQAIDTDARLKEGLNRLALSMAGLSREEYVDEMLLLFKEAGIFLTQSELERLLVLRRQTDRMLAEREQEGLSEGEGEQAPAGKGQ